MLATVVTTAPPLLLPMAGLLEVGALTDCEDVEDVVVVETSSSERR